LTPRLRPTLRALAPLTVETFLAPSRPAVKSRVLARHRGES